MDPHTHTTAHQYDLVAAALHEATHTLFFTDAVTAVLESAGGRPTRFDTFLQHECVGSVLGVGLDHVVLLRDIMSNRLMFRLPRDAVWLLCVP